jgi:hypothetical protein
VSRLPISSTVRTVQISSCLRPNVPSVSIGICPLASVRLGMRMFGSNTKVSTGTATLRRGSIGRGITR